MNFELHMIFFFSFLCFTFIESIQKSGFLDLPKDKISHALMHKKQHGITFYLVSVLEFLRTLVSLNLHQIT